MFSFKTFPFERRQILDLYTYATKCVVYYFQNHTITNNDTTRKKITVTASIEDIQEVR